MVSLNTLVSTNTISTNSNNLALAQASLSSGKAITQASQNVADLVVGTALDTQVTTLRSNLGNASQASSLLQVANGGLDQQLDILEQQKAIATQASSGTIDDTTRQALDQQFQGLSQQLTQISGSTNFNGAPLLDGTLSTSFTLSDENPVSVTLPSTSAQALFNGQALTVGTQPQAAAAATAIDEAIQSLSSVQANVGAVQSQVNAASNNITSALESQTSAASSLLDTDVAAESTTDAAANILLQASIASHAQGNHLHSNLLTLLT